MRVLVVDILVRRIKILIVIDIRTEATRAKIFLLVRTRKTICFSRLLDLVKLYKKFSW